MQYESVRNYSIQQRGGMGADREINPKAEEKPAFLTKAFVSNRSLPVRQRGLTEWKLTWINYSLICASKFRSQPKSTYDLEDQETSSSGLYQTVFQVWLNLWLQISHPT